MSESALRFGQLIRYLHWLDTVLVMEAPFTWLPFQKVRVIARSWPLFLLSLSHSNLYVSFEPEDIYSFFTPSKMRTQSISNEAISEKVKEEAGPRKGFEASQLQSQAAKELNAQKAEQEVVAKMEGPELVTVEDASYVQSREQKAIGGQRPQQAVSRLKFNHHLQRIWQGPPVH